VWCLYRSAWCRVTSFTDALIPWPRVQPIGVRGGSGLWVNDTLVRAIRTESAVALKHWFRASQTAVYNWRVWAGVDGHFTTAGSQREQRKAARLGADATRGAEFPEAEREARRVRAVKDNLIAHARRHRWPAGWTADQDALLGTDTDQAVATKLNKTRAAVRARRHRLGIPATD
jgi:hypothetical protein